MFTEGLAEEVVLGVVNESAVFQGGGHESEVLSDHSGHHGLHETGNESKLDAHTRVYILYFV